MGWAFVFSENRVKIDRLSTQLFLSFAAFSACMLSCVGLFTWMSYQAGIEAASQKILVAEVNAWMADVDQDLPNGKILRAVIGVENVPDELRQNLHQFREEDYSVPLWEWNEIQMWRGPHPRTGEEVFFFLEVGATADREVFAPNLQRGLVLGLALVLLAAVALAYGVSRRLSRPLRDLSESIASINPESPPHPVAPDFPHGETGELARAFDGLQARLQRFTERERRFSRDASHELRTPLTLMRTAVRVLQNSLTYPTEKQERALSHINQGVDEMTTSVESFLYLAREQELHASDGVGAPDAALAQVVDGMKTHFPSAAHRLALTCTGAPQLTVPVDLFRIVASNLIRNAIQHSEDGPIRVSLSSSILIIEDRGPGIPGSVLKKLGQPFPQESSPYGLGLGLSIVSNISRRVDWTLSLSRSDQGGTVAQVRFVDEE